VGWPLTEAIHVHSAIKCSAYRCPRARPLPNRTSAPPIAQEQVSAISRLSSRAPIPSQRPRHPCPSGRWLRREGKAEGGMPSKHCRVDEAEQFFMGKRRLGPGRIEQRAAWLWKKETGHIVVMGILGSNACVRRKSRLSRSAANSMMSDSATAAVE